MDKALLDKVVVEIARLLSIDDLDEAIELLRDLKRQQKLEATPVSKDEDYETRLSRLIGSKRIQKLMS